MPQNKTKSGGFQNYLHEQGRSGLDPLDTSRTAASIEGWFLRRLFTFTLRTRNIFSLAMMLIFGVSLTGLMGFAVYAIITTPSTGELGLIEYVKFVVIYPIFGLIFFIGAFLLINFGINLGIVLGLIKVKSNSQKTKEAKKKIPKRRKDFK